MAVDYPQAQQAATETRASQQAAIAGAESAAQDQSDYMAGRAHEYADWAGGANAASAQQQQANIDKWWADYQNRGGMEGQAKAAGADLESKVRGNLDESGLTATKNAAQSTLSQIPQYQEQYAKAREAGYGALDTVKGEMAGVHDRFAGAKEEARSTMDIAGIKATIESIKNDLMNVRGASEIAGAVASDVQGKGEALQQLESMKSRMTPEQYMAERQRIDQEYNGRISRTSQAIADQKTQEWAKVSTDLESNLTTAKSVLTNNLTQLTLGEGETTVGLASAASNLLNGIVSSLNGETSFVNAAVANAANVGATYAGALNDAATWTANAVWQGINADEKSRSFALVDGPNSILSASNTNTQQIAANYANMMTQAVTMQSQFKELGLQFQYSYSPTFASMGPYMDAMISAVQVGFNDRLSTLQRGDAVHAANQNNALGWAGVGVAAGDAFAPSWSQKNGWSVG